MTGSRETHAAGELSPVPLMELSAGFWGFKTLAAGVELGLFEQLADGGGMTRKDAACQLEIQDRPAGIFLAACASLGLLVKDGEVYRNSPLAQAFLVPGRPNYFGGFVTFVDKREYLPWYRVIEALRGNRPVTWDPDGQDSIFSAGDAVMMEHFWEAMHSLASFAAASLGTAYDFGGHTRLLDVGGGSGIFPIVLCGRYPGLKATVLELEHVCPIAAAKAEQAGLGQVIRTVSGDFRTDTALPDGHDVILLSSILHDWDEATDRDLLGKCFTALPSNGVLLVCELLLNEERTGPASAALMGMDMLVETEGGQNYSVTEYTAWLAETGFVDVRVLPLDAPSCNGVLVARKP